MGKAEDFLKRQVRAQNRSVMKPSSSGSVLCPIQENKSRRNNTRCGEKKKVPRRDSPLDPKAQQEAMVCLRTIANPRNARDKQKALNRLGEICNRRGDSGGSTGDRNEWIHINTAKKPKLPIGKVFSTGAFLIAMIGGLGLIGMLMNDGDNAGYAGQNSPNNQVCRFVDSEVSSSTPSGEEEEISDVYAESSSKTQELAVQDDYAMTYHVSNASGSRIEALYFKHSDSGSWSGNCLADPLTQNWINTTTLFVGKSRRLHGLPTASMQSGGHRQDLDGNWWMAADFLAVDVPLGNYSGYAYDMKVRWQDGSEREFHLPYPWGDVVIYRNQVKVCLGINGRGLFYNNCIDPL